MAARTPAEIARDAVKQLTARKLPPTPENYQTAYHEIAGTQPLRPFPLDSMRRIAQALPERSPGQQRLKAQVEQAVNMHNWDGVQKALVAYASLGPAPLAAPAAATSTVPATAPATAPAALPVSHPASAPAQPHPLASAHFPPDVLDQMARIVEHVLPAVGNHDPKLAMQGEELVAYLRLPTHEPLALKKTLANFAFRLSFVAEEQGLVQTSLLGLIRLMFENIGSLGVDNAWLSGQMTALMEAATPPLSMRRLEALQSRLRDVIQKQSEARERTLAAQAEMKLALASFIERLAAMTEESSQYSDKIERCAQQLEKAQDLTEIAPVLQEAIQASRSMALDTRRASEELRDLRDRTTHAETEIVRLQLELDQMSQLARHDPLTGALNRKGLDETVERELARAQRQQNAVCVGLLDIDNFKRLNDEHGHEVGDEALKHLADVARRCLRPQDSLARFGGEEFVIVMPDTSLEEGVEVMRRVQRELTKSLFLEGNERLLITFSAGVAERLATETGAETLKRADQAMYLAKRSGKNRVVAA
jgi:diguanylate cyclase